MSDLTYVNIDELKEGDIVGYCKYITIGWNDTFRYPIVYKRVIKRITPKRTKFILDNDTELNVNSAKKLVVIDDEAQRQTSIAKVFIDLRSIRCRIENSRSQGVIYIIEKKLADDELIEYYKFMKTIYDKYLGGKNC